MLFNSYLFIFVFLPITLIVYYFLGQIQKTRFAMTWLVLTSLFFYGWWKPEYLILITISISLNYFIGFHLYKNKSKKLLYSGVLLNLSLLGYFKYANFFVDNFNILTNSGITLSKIALPLAISFFTFQQIAFLVDTYRDGANRVNFLDYSLFVTFFPQLVAGPIVHHSEMMPQFTSNRINIDFRNLIIGGSIFVLGLFKKVVLADSIAPYSNAVFTSASLANPIGFLEAWAGALSYTFQLYFDFSGYTDMALGVARMFGIILPLNFFSPYKSSNIIEFWRTWHMTLSRFLKDYLYIPLGGNRLGEARRYYNLMLTMLLGGLWHGAGWNFVIWGGLHGLFLSINHKWQQLINGKYAGNILYKFFAIGLTFSCVTIAWVFFRAEKSSSAIAMIQSMLGMNGIKSKVNSTFGSFGENGTLFGLSLLLIMTVIVFLLPNTQQFFKKYKPCLEDNFKPGRWAWSPKWQYAIFMSIVSALAFFGLTQYSEFLYFNF